ncbi:MAG: DUF1772 domain-containing protein [Pseudonocardia sp.]
MIDSAVPVIALLGVLGCGLMAGLFFAFSTAVMPGLRLRPPVEGLAAMQEMNRTILNPLFGIVFGGTAVLCLLLAVGAPFSGRGGTAWIVIGALLYLVGSTGLTMVVNVPMNNRLDAADPTSAEGQAFWSDYLARWTAWNHVRALACAAATVALTVGLWS